MNYNYLRYFSVLAQLEHYTLAAARLEISQPSLSSAIRNLEDELGVKLFEKVGRNIRLTEEGRYFQKKVDFAMGELVEATEALQSSRENAPVVISSRRRLKPIRPPPAWKNSTLPRRKGACSLRS